MTNTPEKRFVMRPHGDSWMGWDTLRDRQISSLTASYTNCRIVVDRLNKGFESADRTRVVPSRTVGYGPGQYVAQYWDDEFRVWFDIGGPRDARADAVIMAEEFSIQRVVSESEGA